MTMQQEAGMTEQELERLEALAITPVAVLVKPKPPLGRHAVLIRDDGSFLMPEGAECESLYKHSDCKAVVDAKAALVAEVRLLTDERDAANTSAAFWNKAHRADLMQADRDKAALRGEVERLREIEAAARLLVNADNDKVQAELIVLLRAALKKNGRAV